MSVSQNDKIRRPTSELINEENLFKSLMLHSENIINFYVPVYDNQENIINFRVVYFNDLAREYIELKNEEAIGRLLSEVYPSVHDKGGVDFLKEAFLSNRAQTRIRMYHHKGVEKSLKTTVQPTHQGILATTVDISENRELRKELDASHKKLEAQILELENERYFSQKVLDASNNIILFFLPEMDDKKEVVDFKIEYVNDRITDAIRKRKEGVIGRKMTEFYPNGFDNGDFEILRACYSNGKDVEMTKQFKISGNYYWFANRLVKLNEGLLIFAKNITKEKEFEEELLLRHRLMSRAESVAHIGSYKWNLDENRLTYSDNAYRLFGYEPGDFEPSFEKFMSFVHPEDAPSLEASAEEVLEKKEWTESTYRIITKDNRTRTITSVGEFYQRRGQWLMVGVLKDVTDEVNSETRLRRQNIELQRSNSELESFNRVASHDLQEPLRKIQMFISRIEDMDGDTLSGRSLEFMEKITDASERMRELIQNLLSYSKVGDQSGKFEKVDLNKLLKSVLQEFEERITEANAKIEFERLPFIYGIEFQLEQLLGNLISNALKYRNEGVAPVINIKSQIVPFSAVDPELGLTRSRYLVLTVTDNGIGFEEEYASKIFDLFQRLHSKNDFSGTGLGLAICQKIVENHQGYIMAEGKPGEGSTFSIYLPYSAY